MFVATTATRRVAAMRRRIRAVIGGTSASKTISILLILIDKAQSDKVPTLTSVVSESIPHLKRGAMRDFRNIMETQRYWKDDSWNATDSTYTFETGSRFEFFSTDNGDKLRGARRDRCFLNEANNNTLDAFNQLEVRTREVFYLDWNPTVEFWYYTEVKPTRDDVEEITLTYLDNEALDQQIVASIEKRRLNKRWWTVYGEGRLGEVESRIYTGWTVIDEIPPEARLERRGMDFGYTNDPTAIVDVHKWNGAWVIDERCYQTRMQNRVIADLLKSFGYVMTFADSAEPKSIDEIRLSGYTLFPANKGPGSVSQGIDFIQGQRILVTKSSVNLLREYRGYLWKEDRDGKLTNDPVGGGDHALDALRYAFSGMADQQVDDLHMQRERAFIHRHNQQQDYGD